MAPKNYTAILVYLTESVQHEFHYVLVFCVSSVVENRKHKENNFCIFFVLDFNTINLLIIFLPECLIALTPQPRCWDTSPLLQWVATFPSTLSPRYKQQVVQLFFFYCETSLSVFVTPDLCLFNSEDNALRLQCMFLAFIKNASLHLNMNELQVTLQ